VSLRVRVLGPGRAGQSFAIALRNVGWIVEVQDRLTHPADSAVDTDLLLICVPDPVLAEVAQQVRPVDSTVVAHCAGAFGTEVLIHHARRAALHPLVSMPSPEIGAQRLNGAWFSRSGDPAVNEIIEALGGTGVELADADRVRYHAAAAMASNHLVALLGQVERVAQEVGVPLEAFLDLARGGVESVAKIGPAAALTGPVARGDVAMVRRHLGELPVEEQAAYRALAERAAALVGRGDEFGFLLDELRGQSLPGETDVPTEPF